MKYLNGLCILFTLLSLSLSGQRTEIAFQGFESSGNSWEISRFSSPPCTIGSDSWNYHSQLGEILPYGADFFWGITDLNGDCGSPGFESIEFREVDISNYRNVELSFFINVQGFDNGDDMKYQLWYDKITEPEQLFVDGSDNFSTSGWQEIKISIPNAVSEVKIAVSIRQNGSDYAGLDNFSLSGIPIIPCSEIFISEYVEGTSSSGHRNNYIELYNPTPDNIDLAEYTLVKYTGKSLTPSSRLELFGNISSYDTFLIEDIKEQLDIEANISTNSSAMDYNGDDKIALLKNGSVLDLIGDIGDSLFFARDLTLQRKSEIQQPNNQYQIEEWESYALEHITNLNNHASICQGPLPEIEVFGNSKVIQDGDLKTSLLNNTYLGSLDQQAYGAITKSYTIKNSGTSDLEIFGINITGEHAAMFNASLDSETISPGDSLHFSISFLAKQLGVKTAMININNNDPSERQFSFKIQGEITGRSGSPLIISQYYEGKGNDKWIEITNTGSLSTNENSYYVCLFRNDAVYSPLDSKPSAKKEIPPLEPGESVLFRAALTVNQPIYALSQNSVKSSVCSFSGDDILIISTSGEENSWSDKTDLIGNIGNWGSDLSLVRKTGCLANGANTGFQPADWNLFSIEQINLATVGKSERIGEHYLGSTVWANKAWQNGLPSFERNVRISENYTTALYGEIEACNLEILSGAHFKVSAGQQTAIKNNLNVDGLMEIDNQASLIMINDYGKVIHQGQILVNKIARNLKPSDYVYWSSPVKTAILESVFDRSPTDSFYSFSTSDFSDLDSDGRDDDQNAWQRAFGAMEIARGYTAMAPNLSQTDFDYRVEFTGELNTGIIKIPLELQNENFNSDDDWNLIGNPYPSSIDANLLFFHPENKDLMKGTIYLWTHNSLPEKSSEQEVRYSSNDYAMYTIGTGGIRAQSGGKTPTQYISSCQGFFIEAEKSGELTFNNSMRSHLNADHFFKANGTKYNSEQAKIWLNLYNDQGAFSQILIGFIEGATTGIDQLYDGNRLSGNEHLSFYSLADNVKLAIQGSPPFRGSETITLGFDNWIEDSVSLRVGIDQISPLLKEKAEGIYLFDKKTERHHDLQTSDYEFKAPHNEDQSDRFLLYFSNQGNNFFNNENHTERIHWYSQNDILYIKSLSNEKIKDVQMYDLNGRIIRKVQVDDFKTRLFWSGLATRAIYILRVRLQNQNTITKRIIHY